jgi:eukaryotic-like serine/threonine-protein kinase
VGKAASVCLDEHDVLAFVTGELDADRRRAALEHVDECQSCRALTAALARDEDVGPADVSLTKGVAAVRALATSDALLDGRFRLVSALGRGAMGTVYRAHDEQLGTDVALKLLREGTAEGGADARAFARELKVGRRVTHPNVCRLHDAGRSDGVSYITMELVDGETLAELLAREKPTIARADEILLGVASGLAAVHAQGIVHRDLKPANIMIERASGNAILTDFGFAADLDSKQSRRLVGTPSFWAPEQARGEAPTPASDVFSFGILAYRLLAGREYSMSDEKALDAVPRSHRSLIARCLEPRPTDRFVDAGSVLESLRPRSNRPRIAWMLGAAIVAVVGLVFLMPHREPAPSTGPTSPTSAVTYLQPAPTPEASPRGSTETTPPPVSSPAGSSAAVVVEQQKPGHTATGVRGVHPAVRVLGRPAASGPATPSSSEPDPLYRH